MNYNQLQIIKLTKKAEDILNAPAPSVEALKDVYIRLNSAYHLINDIELKEVQEVLK